MFLGGVGEGQSDGVGSARQTHNRIAPRSSLTYLPNPLEGDAHRRHVQMQERGPVLHEAREQEGGGEEQEGKGGGDPL